MMCHSFIRVVKLFINNIIKSQLLPNTWRSPICDRNKNFASNFVSMSLVLIFIIVKTMF